MPRFPPLDDVSEVSCYVDAMQHGLDVTDAIRVISDRTGRIAAKAINHLGDEVMKVFRV